jgi:hypothetical protein
LNLVGASSASMWLTLGRDCAGADESWVKPVYDSAFKRASDDERAKARRTARRAGADSFPRDAG